MRISTRSQQLADLLSTVEVLHPGASVKTGLVTGRDVQFRLVPNARRPRMLVPAGSPRAAASAVDRPSANDTAWRSAPRRMLSGLLSTRLGSAAMPFGLSVHAAPDSISDYLQEVLGEPVLISLMVGSARANRKPILNVHRPDGTEIGFAKVGLSTLTNQLVQHEGTVLKFLAAERPTAFSAPGVLHHGVWRDHEVLIMSSLRPDRPQRKPQAPLAAVAQIAAMTGVQVIPIGSSPWRDRLSSVIEPFRNTEDGLLTEMLDRYLDLYGDVELPFGAWHGDFGAWNLARTSTVPMIWDWERFSADIPVGCDIVHYLAHQILRRRGDTAAARAALDDLSRPALSAVLRCEPATARYAGDPLLLRAITVGYLLTIAARFTADSHTEQGQPVQSLARWHQRVLADQLQVGDSSALLRSPERKKPS